MKLHSIASTILRLVSSLISPCGVPVQNQRHPGFFISLWLNIKSDVTEDCLYRIQDLVYFLLFVDRELAVP